MNVKDAAYDTAHEYSGGLPALATRMGMSEAVLRGKVNPNSDRNRLALEEADEMMGKSGDLRILHALAANHGGIFVQLDTPTSGSLIGALLATDSAKGDLSKIVAAAVTDGRLTPNERAKIRKACAAVQALVALVNQHANVPPVEAT